MTTLDDAAARNWHLDVTLANPTGVTKEEFINRAALDQQPGPEQHTIPATTSSPEAR
jgi:hypothetical protein